MVSGDSPRFIIQPYLLSGTIYQPGISLSFFTYMMIIRYSLIGLLWELRWCWAWFIVNNQYLQLTLCWKTYQHVLLIESVLQTAPILKTYNLKFHFPVKSWFCIQIIYFPHSLLSKNRTVAVNIFLCDRDIGKFITSRDIKCMRHWTCAGLS